MNLPASELRRPPGPDESVSPGVDRETLDLLTHLRDCYGNIVMMRKADGRDAVFINDAREVHKLLVRRHERCHKGPGFERVKMLLGNGLIVSDGATWRRSRTMVQPAFSRQNVHRLIDVMVGCCETRLERWRDIAGTKGWLNITQETSDFALELIMRAIFGADYETGILRDGTNPFAFLSEDSTRDLRVVLRIRELRRLLLEIIGNRREAGRVDGSDFLSVYLSATDKNGNGFSAEELLDELVTLIVAGYETSAGTLNWAWYLLARHGDAQRRLLDEAQALIPDAPKIDAQSISDMAYAQQFIDETLRLYPPVWLFTRRAIEYDSLADFDLRAGTDIYLSPYILHRTEEYWPDPDSFDPDRFEPGGRYAKGDRPYFPFSLGPRRCLGEYFSFLEMKIHLGLLVQKFHMTAADEKDPGLDFGINLRSRNDIILRLKLREKP